MKRTIIVSGLGRCGSSMAMQMLAASGLKCAGDAPSYECHIDHDEDDEGVRTYSIARELIEAHDAIKILWPSKFAFPPIPGALVVWLDRNWREQCRSLRKLAATVSNAVPPESPEVLRTMHLHLIREREASIAAIRGYPRIETSFENLVSHPFDACCDIAEFASEYGVMLDPSRMAAVIEGRSVRCAGDLSRELRLIDKAESHGTAN
jgi:hypothetical protein